MPRIPTHTVATAPEQSREPAARFEKRMGRLMNIHAGMAHSPVVIGAYEGLGDAIRRLGTFDGRTRETIALAVALILLGVGGYMGSGGASLTALIPAAFGVVLLILTLMGRV